MSTKTSIKRIALVAVSALGLGLVTTVSASAAQAAADAVALQLEGAAVSQTLTQREDVATGTTNLSVGLDVTSPGNDKTVTLFAAFTSKPAASVLTNGNLTFGATGNYATDSASGTTVVTATAGTGSTAAQLTIAPSSGAALADDANVGEFAFTPDTPGTYVVRIWHDANDNLLYDSGEATRTVTVYAGAAPATATFTQYASTSSVTGDAANALELGSLVLISLKDASGNPTSLGTNEGLTITATGSATLSVDNWSNSVAGTTGITLTSSTSPSAYGMYRLNIKDTVAETSTITISGAGSLAGVISTQTTTATFVAVVDEDAAPASNAMTTGTDGTAIGAVSSVSNGTDIALGTANKTATITFTSAADSTATRYVGMAVYDTTGALTGYPTAGYTDVVSISGTAAGTATKSFTATYWSATTRARTNAAGADSFVVSTLDLSGTATDGRGAEYIATAAANNATNSSFNVTNVSATAGGQVSVILTVKDQFGNVRAGQGVTFVITGRNALNTVSTAAVTDAGGQATFTYTDIGTATSSTTDTITVSGLAVTGVTVSFGAANSVSSVLLDSDDTTAGVANPVKAPQGVISAAKAGAQAGVKTVSATVTNAAGTALVGVPCVWSVAGDGAAILSTKKTTYTDALGACTTSVYAWIAGTYTVTATAGGKSGTATETFYNATPSTVRTVSATVSGSQVVATAKDRFGNPVAGATLYAIASGGANIGGKLIDSSSTTDKNGQITWIITGSGSVKVTTINPSGNGAATDQSTAAAGYVAGDVATPVAFTAYVAGTATTAETGVGASFAPAGVSSVTVDVTTVGSSDSVDAANEATDAANAATDAANAAAEAADAATAAAQDAQAAVAALATQVASLIAGIKAQITTLTNLVIKIQKKVKA